MKPENENDFEIRRLRLVTAANIAKTAGVCEMTVTRFIDATRIEPDAELITAGGDGKTILGYAESRAKMIVEILKLDATPDERASFAKDILIPPIFGEREWHKASRWEGE